MRMDLKTKGPVPAPQNKETSDERSFENEPRTKLSSNKFVKDSCFFSSWCSNTHLQAVCQSTVGIGITGLQFKADLSEAIASGMFTDICIITESLCSSDTYLVTTSSLPVSPHHSSPYPSVICNTHLSLVVTSYQTAKISCAISTCRMLS